MSALAPFSTVSAISALVGPMPNVNPDGPIGRRILARRRVIRWAWVAAARRAYLDD